MASPPACTKSTNNRLLTGLPPDVLAQLLPKLSRVSLSNRQVLYGPEQRIEAVFFVEAGMISMVAQLDDGQLAEVGIIGYEGMAGLPLIFGVESSFNETSCKCRERLCGWTPGLSGESWCQTIL